MLDETSREGQREGEPVSAFVLHHIAWRLRHDSLYVDDVEGQIEMEYQGSLIALFRLEWSCIDAPLALVYEMKFDRRVDDSFRVSLVPDVDEKRLLVGSVLLFITEHWLGH
jgi:hypothetical protein